MVKFLVADDVFIDKRDVRSDFVNLKYICLVYVRSDFVNLKIYMSGFLEIFL